MYSVTSAPQSLQDDQSYRMRRYLLSMGTRTVCFLLAVLFLAVLHWTIAGWVMVVGAVLLPYVAVVMANVSRSRFSSALGPLPPPSRRAIEGYVAAPAPRRRRPQHPRGPVRTLGHGSGRRVRAATATARSGREPRRPPRRRRAVPTPPDLQREGLPRGRGVRAAVEQPQAAHPGPAQDLAGLRGSTARAWARSCRCAASCATPCRSASWTSATEPGPPPFPGRAPAKCCADGASGVRLRPC